MPSRNQRTDVPALAVLFVLMLAALARAADPVPKRVVVRKPPVWEPCATAQAAAAKRCATLVVDFEAALSAEQQKQVIGTAPAVGRIWLVQTVPVASGTPKGLPIVNAIYRPTLTGLVFLVLGETVTASDVETSTHLVTVTYLGPPAATVVSAGPTEPDEETGLVVDAADPDDPDLLLSGKIKAAQHAGPLFNIEAKLRKTWFAGRNELGGVAELVAEEQKNADPDSIKAGFFFKRVVQSWRSEIVALPFSGEFSRTDPRTEAYVSAWDLVWNAVPTTGRAVALDVIVGGAFGTSRKNAISDEGSGSIARGKIGVQAWSQWTRFLRFKKVTLAGTWTRLALAQSEIDPERLDADERPTLTRRARTRITGDLDLSFTSRFALGLQYRQGPLPPAFEKVNPSIAVTLVYKADWR